tara:strand:- start:754 stop:1161 length:408 start_codon:yes stop_codon:yes gene_type:complete
MLAVIADLYLPILGLFCVYYLRFQMGKKLALSFMLAYFYVYVFAYIEFYFSWWLSMGADFSSHTAAVMVMVFALLSVNYKVGVYAFISMLLYGLLMNVLHYHSWFDILTTIVVCLPCWGLFSIVNFTSSGRSLVR